MPDCKNNRTWLFKLATGQGSLFVGLAVLICGCTSATQIDETGYRKLGIDFDGEYRVLLGLENLRSNDYDHRSAESLSENQRRRSQSWVVKSSAAPSLAVPAAGSRAASNSSTSAQSGAFDIQVLINSALAMGVEPSTLEWAASSPPPSDRPRGSICEWQSESWDVRIRFIEHHGQWLSVIEAFEVD